jgi:hypothetical protein
MFTGTDTPGRISADEAMKRRDVNAESFLTRDVSRTKRLPRIVTNVRGTVRGMKGNKNG